MSVVTRIDSDENAHAGVASFMGMTHRQDQRIFNGVQAMGAMGDRFGAYVQPLIDDTDGSMEQVERAMDLGMMCWNLGSLPEGERNDFIESMKVTMNMDDAGFEQIKQGIILPMIQRRLEMFPDRVHYPSAQESRRADRQASSPWTLESPSKPASPAPTKTGRYDPCPCNSGRKYKFCCGQSVSSF